MTKQAEIEAVCVGYFRELILGELDRHCTVWIAGGAVRDYFAGIDNPTDIDLYFPSEEEFNQCKTHLRVNGGVQTFENKNAVRIKYKGQSYDLCKAFFPTPKDTIQNFDFYVCCAAVDIEKVYTATLFFYYLKTKELRINKLPFPTSTLLRLQKYFRKGYKIDKETLLKLAEAIRNTKEDSVDDGYSADVEEADWATVATTPEEDFPF